MTSAEFEGWNTISFPFDKTLILNEPCIYAWCVRDIPFYIGESGSRPHDLRRVYDDYSGNRKDGTPRLNHFQNSPIDFDVAFTRDYFGNKGFPINLKLVQSSIDEIERRKRERALVRSLLLKGVVLLNFFTGCCRAETEAEEKAALKGFCEMLLQHYGLQVNIVEEVTQDGFRILRESAEDMLLWAYYTHYNHMCFSGSLPPVPLYWAKSITLPDGGHANAVYVSEETPDGQKRRYIAVDEKLQSMFPLERLCLLHEMVHLKVPGHADDFIAEFKRVLDANKWEVMGCIDALPRGKSEIPGSDPEK